MDSMSAAVLSTVGLDPVRQIKLRLPEVRPRVLDRAAVSYDPATSEHD